MEEVSHVIQVLSEAKDAFINGDSPKLRDLSNQTIHSASLVQDAGSIALAVIVYSLAKIIERGDNRKIKHWDKVANKIEDFTSLAITALKEGKIEAYESYLERIRSAITSVSANLKPYISDVLERAAINKASKIYEHGISMGQTAKLLGISQWELSEYLGQKLVEIKAGEDPLSAKHRAEMALEFFS